MFENEKRIHFIGIGGIMMSGLALALNWRGFTVSGSDVAASGMTEKLAASGIRVIIGHQSANLGEAEAVVVSSAIAAENPELVLAKARNLPVLHRSDVLAMIMREKKAVAIAGAHGKTTTTSMLGVTLHAAGLEPTVVIGGVVNSLGGNIILGNGEYCVAEADESDGSFLRLPKKYAVITNIEDDHLEHYGSMENILRAFREFLAGLPADGVAILCADDDNIMSVIDAAPCKTITYSLKNPAAGVYADKIDFTSGKAKFDVYVNGQVWGRAALGMPGKYNVLNALAVAALSNYLGVNFETYASAMAGFTGANRRFQIKGEINGVLIVDDYAHHPTEINATLQAAKDIGRKRVICAFQPHRYSRTQQLRHEFGACFDAADTVVFTDIYSASEMPVPGIDGGTIPDEYRLHSGRTAVYVAERADMAAWLAKTALPGDIIITMGAGDITKVSDELVELLQYRTNGDE